MRILGIAGSVRRESHNRKLLRAAGDVLPPGVELVEWDGLQARRTRIAPDIHMVAHHAIDDPATPRIGHWLDAFRRAGVADGEDWWMPWLDVVARSTGDPSASVLRRDERIYVTLSGVTGELTRGLTKESLTVGPGDLDLVRPVAVARTSGRFIVTLLGSTTRRPRR